MFFENVVAQQLVANGHSLIFSKFRFKDPETGDVKPYEIDFLLAGRKVSPIEVKSTNYRECKSMDTFRRKYKGVTGKCYVIHGRDLSVDGDLTRIPVYMTLFL